MKAMAAVKFLNRFYDLSNGFNGIEAEAFSDDSVFKSSFLAGDKSGESYTMLMTTKKAYPFSRDIEALVPESLLGGKVMSKSVSLIEEGSSSNNIFNLIILRSSSKQELENLHKDLQNIRNAERPQSVVSRG